MYNTTFYNATLNLYKQTTSFQRLLMAVLKRQNKARMNSEQAKNTTKLGVSVSQHEKLNLRVRKDGVKNA